MSSGIDSQILFSAPRSSAGACGVSMFENRYSLPEAEGRGILSEAILPVGREMMAGRPSRPMCFLLTLSIVGIAFQ